MNAHLPVMPVCDICGRIARFRFAGAGPTPALRCWRHAVFYGPVFRRALQVAAVVGTLLFLINQLDVVLSGKVTLLVVLKIILTYLTPFLVSTYSALEPNRLRSARSAPSETPPATSGAVA
jgi:hypothetical protein